MSRAFYLILAALFAVTMAGCGNDDSGDETSENKSSSSSDDDGSDYNGADDNPENDTRGDDYGGGGGDGGSGGDDQSYDDGRSGRESRDGEGYGDDYSDGRPGREPRDGESYDDGRPGREPRDGESYDDDYSDGRPGREPRDGESYDDGRPGREPRDGESYDDDYSDGRPGREPRDGESYDDDYSDGRPGREPRDDRGREPRDDRGREPRDGESYDDDYSDGRPGREPRDPGRRPRDDDQYDDGRPDGRDRGSDDDIYNDNPDGRDGRSEPGRGPGDDDTYDEGPRGRGSDDDVYGDGEDGPRGPRRGSPKKPQTYAEQARASFEQGHDNMAIRYSYAAMLTDPTAAKAARLQLWAGPKKPTMVLRWGVGINYIAPKSLTSRPPMIGDKPNLPDRKRGGGRKGGRRVIGQRDNGGFDNGGFDEGPTDPGAGPGEDIYGGEGEGRGGGGKFRMPSGARGQLTYLTGEVGERLLERLEMRRVRGYYGAILKSAPRTQEQASRRGGPEGRDAFGPGPGPGRDPGREGGGDEYADDGGEDYGEDSYGEEGRGEGRGAAATNGPQLIPGVTMLGMGNAKVLMGRAKQQNIDVLVVFDVTYTKNLRTNLEKNETMIRLYSVAANKEVRKSAVLNNLGVWHARETLKDKSKDPVDLAIDSILRDFADEHVRLTDLPALDAAKAKFRVKNLISSKPADPLPVLAEIKYFHTKGWLTDSDLAVAYKGVIGPSGQQLASDSLEEQKKALSLMLDQAVESGEETPFDDGGFGKGGFR